MNPITLTIDGRQLTCQPGKTVLQAAREAGIEIPSLCDHPALPPYGACRLCIVEIDGVRGYPTSCTTPAAEGMVVRTQSRELQKLRNRVLELLMSGHPNSCLVCEYRERCEKHRPRPAKAGRSTRCALCSNRPSCDLRGMALQAGSSELNLRTIYSRQNIERIDPFIDRDLNLCVLCARCWRICEKIHGRPAISIIKRGKQARIGTLFNQSWVDSGCTFCGACVDICPTGSLTDRYARWYGRPEGRLPSTCTLCPEGCSLVEQTSDGKVVATRMTHFERDSRLCAVGRFAFAQLMSTHQRLQFPMVRERGELIPVEWSEAIAALAVRLQPFQGNGQFAMVIGEAEIRETNFIYEKFARQVMQGRIVRVPAGANRNHPALTALGADIHCGKIKAVWLTGDYLDTPELDALDYLVVADIVPSNVSLRASAVLPAAVLSEVTGTFRTAANEVKTLGPALPSPGQARIEWKTTVDLAKAMGAQGFDYEFPFQIAKDISEDAVPAPLPVAPRDNARTLADRFRGHNLADLVPALEVLGIMRTAPEKRPETGKRFPVVSKEEVAPNFHLVKIEAPAIAQHARPGQFVIVMVKETSERAPYTLADWDRATGTITFVVEEVGRSSREIAMLQAGDQIAHVSGPLGTPFPIRNVGSVALGGGCYGIAAIYPLARSMKRAGNKVRCVIEACSQYLLYMEDRLRSVCDELVFTTRDGSRGRRGGVQDVFAEWLGGPEPPNLMVAIGCTFMMQLTEEATRPFDIPLYVALNPIMVDGTGMCGACRVSVQGKTKFACVDGPFFEGHAVDWDELSARRSAYTKVEIEALAQETEHAHVHQHC
ncbi:MAG: sulfide/dihydroorotate dehydrogenase-like FAD/NAD-binding protein [Candidatus Omnitrophica bacterium]|nr:sulfide/dihydroorotate dehydrogenase-like FAD/NAD-binding protein [Candidatus Omnitrophota bacterium]